MHCAAVNFTPCGADPRDRAEGSRNFLDRKETLGRAIDARGNRVRTAPKSSVLVSKEPCLWWRRPKRALVLQSPSIAHSLVPHRRKPLKRAGKSCAICSHFRLNTQAGCRFDETGFGERALRRHGRTRTQVQSQLSDPLHGAKGPTLPRIRHDNAGGSTSKVSSDSNVFAHLDTAANG